MKRILVAGGSGLIGMALSREAKARGYEVLLLSRSPGPGRITWDPANQQMDLDHQQTFDAIINLAGTNIGGGRWTARRKQDIVSSRVNSGLTIREYLRKGHLQTSLYIGASGIGYFRNNGEEAVDENSKTQFPDDWMVQTVKQWEDAHQLISAMGIRTVVLRFGNVLSVEGGALKELLNPARFGLLAYFGTGRQYWPWIHIRDAARILLNPIEQIDWEGLFLAVSPGTVRNKVFTQSINKHLSPRRLVLPAPRFVLRLMLGELHSVLFDSCNAYPKRLLEKNFTFLFPDIESAMKDLLSKH